MAKTSLKDLIESFSISSEEKAQLNTAIEETLAATSKASAEKVSALETELEETKKQLEEKSKELSLETGVVPGTYTSKKHKKTVRFKQGVLKFNFKADRDKSSTVYESAAALKDADLMEQLIALEVGFLEEVEEA